MKEIQFEPGEVILHEGDPSETVFQLLSGQVEVYGKRKEQIVVLGHLEAGDYLGEMGLIDEQPRSTSARAVTDVAAVELERWEFIRLVSEQPASAYRLISRLAQHLRRMNKDLLSLADDLEDGVPDHSTQHEMPQAVTLYAAIDDIAGHVPKEGVTIATFGFSIGRLPEPAERGWADFQLPDSVPSRLSLRHFAVVSLEGVWAVQDLDSELGTEVNGTVIGRDFNSDFLELKSGDNAVVAGGSDSPFCFRLSVA
jgi:CRP-like cAMP-binding protein|tara:strand:+ start:12489 stop:13250 length:762 start_codon:yes stop_codon:yes gene_type:complete